MPKRISSSDWTGPIDRTVRRGAFTHRVGEFGGTTDYAWLSHEQPFTLAVPPELRDVLRLAAGLLFLPLILVAGWLIAQVGIRDELVSDQSGLLILWGWLIVGVAFWQIMSRSLQLIPFRKLLLSVLITATIGLAIAYPYFAQAAHATAMVSKPERMFVYVAGTKRTLSGRMPIIRHQRADGSDIEGRSKWPPFAHGTCVTMQRVVGSYGFRWLRVIERVPPPGPGQLSWPVRREDCFSSKPLAEARR